VAGIVVAACDGSQVTAPRADDGGAADATEAGAEQDAGMDSGGEDARDERSSGTFGHCCVDGVLASCYCPSNVTCHFGTQCADGRCVEGDGAACPAPRDAGFTD
jgi:hypothetical protein